jgi:predicted RNase H-like HicB family nuclease
MKQFYHTIITRRPDGWFVGWVEEIRGTMSLGRTLDECQMNLKDSLQLMLQTHRDEARQPLNQQRLPCILGEIEIDDAEIGLAV